MASGLHFRREARLSDTVVLAAAVAVLAVSGSEASTNRMSCGDTITADTTLHADLLDCPNNGIVIAADDVSLDLNGHSVGGDGRPVSGARKANSATSACSTTATMASR